METDVLIVGAGPVGLTLGLDLAGRDLKVTIAERRNAAEPPSAICNHVAARRMEIFRRLGAASTVRNAGLPADLPHDVAFRTSAAGFEMSRIPIPSRARRFVAKAGPDTGWPTAEPPHRINQTFLEPLLFAAAEQTPGYACEDSPIVAHDRERAPEYSLSDFTPSTFPGCRTPHLWLADGRSLYDALGPGFTLLRFDREIGAPWR
jgi:2-polyprenyl-6-methoxyphenol hydroxylase-like FAD-dependent oxidoreductase